jgi:hypothetical protein
MNRGGRDSGRIGSNPYYEGVPQDSDALEEDDFIMREVRQQKVNLQPPNVKHKNVRGDLPHLSSDNV